MEDLNGFSSAEYTFFSSEKTLKELPSLFENPHPQRETARQPLASTPWPALSKGELCRCPFRN